MPAPIVNSKMCLPDSSINEFLNYFGTRNFGKIKGYTVEWVAQKIREENPETAISILKAWSHQSQECSENRIKELNMLTNKEVVRELLEIVREHLYFHP